MSSEECNEQCVVIRQFRQQKGGAFYSSASSILFFMSWCWFNLFVHLEILLHGRDNPWEMMTSKARARDKQPQSQAQAEVLQLYTIHFPHLFVRKERCFQDLQLSSRRATSTNKHPAESYPNHEVVQGSCSSIQYSDPSEGSYLETALLSRQIMVAVRQTLSLPIHEEGGGLVGSAHNL
eukprot:scaffold17392_cov131-Skeletonema_marinoi.AAC.1